MTPILSKILQYILVALIAVVAFRMAFPPTTKIVDRIVHVGLTKAQLDSMGLSIKERLKGEMKTRYIPQPYSVIDTAGIDSLKNEIFSLKGQLIGRAELNLTFDGLVGKYDDSLLVVADFVSDSISIDFRPNPRELSTSIRDTIETGGFGIWEAVGLVGAGILIDRVIK